MRFRVSILFIVLVCLCFSGPVAGAEYLQMDEITVKGINESTQAESLTIREVRESPARDIGEALKQVEGIDIVRKGATANDVVLRGQQKDNINVFLDGMRLHGACPSRMDSPSFHFDFAEIEQIRIVKGPYDLTNPGGIGGVIDAVSKKNGRGIASDLSLTYGSYNMANAAVTASYGNELFDVLLGYAFKYSGVPESGDGRRITDIYSATSLNRYKTDTSDTGAYQINTGWSKLGLNLTSNSRMEIGYSYQDADHVLYPYLLMDADYDRTHQLNWSYRIEKVSPVVREIKLQAYWDKVRHLMDDRERFSSLNKPLIYSMQTDASTQVVGAKLNGAFAVGPGILTSGLDFYNRNWDAVNRTMAGGYKDTFMIPDVYTDNLGFFADYELPVVEKLTLKGGLRGDLTWVNTDKPTNKAISDTDYNSVSGNIQLIWAPLEHLEISTGFGSGVRPPDPQELFINSSKQQGNPFLNPTRNNEADLGVKYATERFFIKAAIFNSSLDDYINIVQSGTTRSYNNINANIWGAELGSQFALPYDLFLKASLSYTEGKNTSNGRPLSEIPPLKGMLAMRYDVDTWFVEVAENFANSQDNVDSALGEQATAGWMTTDLKAGYKYKALSVYAGIYNLLDKFYYSHLSYQRDPFASGVKVPENGRNFYLTVAYKF
ncbi:MAG: TonB-dependent receptor [Pedobacter sp.]